MQTEKFVVKLSNVLVKPSNVSEAGASAGATASQSEPNLLSRLFVIIDYSLTSRYRAHRISKVESDNEWPCSRTLANTKNEYRIFNGTEIDVCVMMDGNSTLYMAVEVSENEPSVTLSGVTDAELHGVTFDKFKIPDFKVHKQSDQSVDKEKLANEVTLVNDIVSFVGTEVFTKYVGRKYRYPTEFCPFGIMFPFPVEISASKKRKTSETRQQENAHDEKDHFHYDLLQLRKKCSPSDAARMMATIVKCIESDSLSKIAIEETWPVNVDYNANVLEFSYNGIPFRICLMETVDFYMSAKNGRDEVICAKKIVKPLTPEYTEDEKVSDNARIGALSIYINDFLKFIYKNRDPESSDESSTSSQSSDEISTISDNSKVANWLKGTNFVNP